MNINSIKRDFLKELFNISVGKAASVLSEIVNKKINLRVPELKLINMEENPSEFYDYILNVGSGSILVSSLSFNKDIKGIANLIFPANKMRSIISLCMNEDEVDDLQDLDYNDVDFDVLREVGNIILNSIIGEIGNYFKVKIEYTIPGVRVVDIDHCEKLLVDNNYSYVLLLYITFNIDGSEVSGAIILNLNIESIDEIFDKIDTVDVI